MNKFFRFLLLCIVFWGLVQNSFAQTVYENCQDGKLYLKIKNTVIPALPDFDGRDASAYSKEFQTLIQQFGIYSVHKAFPLLKTVELQHSYKILFHQTGKVDELIKAFQKIGITEYAEKVPLYRCVLNPNDPNYGQQYALPIINAPNAWNIHADTHATKVAVVDNAVMLNHVDLTANRWVNPGEIPGNGIDDDGNGYIDDINGWDAADNDNDPNPPLSANAGFFEHGTHCGGIADAVTNNNIGVASIGFNLSLIGVKCVQDTATDPNSIPFAMEGVQYAIVAGADVISMSWGGDPFSQTEQNVFTAGWNQGIIFCAAGGNDGLNEQFYPANYNNVVAVGSTTNTDAMSNFSNFGAWLDVVAPGSNIYSTVPNNGGGSTYANLSGTSMATPLVAGLCGLMKSYSPTMTNVQIVSCLKSSCDNIDAQNPGYVGLMGAGRINAYAALQCLVAAPVANLSAIPAQTCTGVVSFTDLSVSNPTSWLWDFGDGTTSALQNPVHEYFINGTFTVILTVSSGFGTDTATFTNYITVSRPAAPAFTAGTHCGPGTVTLTVTASNPVRWYANATDANPISTSNPFITPSISTSTTYYVEDSLPGTVGAVGAASTSTLGTGGYFSNATDRYLIFDAISSFQLISVLIDAQGAGVRTIELRNSAGVVLQTVSPNLPNGVSTVTLNFSVPVGTNYELAINGTANLFRNNAGGGNNFYPLTLAGVVSITGSSAGAGYYYYFYNWQVQAAGCISLRAEVTAVITPGLTLTSNITDAACFGGNNGSAGVSVSGGTPVYTYLWSTGTTSATATNLTAGTYTVTTNDAGGCSSTASEIVTEPVALTVSVSSVNADCGLSNGSAMATSSGGTSGYSYIWNNGATTAGISNLAAGNYSVTTTDAHNCTTTSSANILSTSTVSETHAAVNVTCFGLGNGSASITIISGTPPYTYVWSNGGTASSISNVGGGTYFVTITDGSSCQKIDTVMLNEPLAISATFNTVNATCFGVANGSHIAVFTGGVTPFASVNWSNGATGSILTGLAAGNYSVTATDANGCTFTSGSSITEPTRITFTTDSIDATIGQSNGSAMVNNTSGGTSPYTYLWSTGATTSTISGVTAGTYTVTITDAAGCTSTAAVIVNQTTGVGSTSGDIAFRVFPNPASNQVTISISKVEPGATLAVSDVLGQTLMSRTISSIKTNIDVSLLAAGVYFVEVKEGKIKEIMRFEIRR